MIARLKIDDTEATTLEGTWKSPSIVSDAAGRLTQKDAGQICLDRPSSGIQNESGDVGCDEYRVTRRFSDGKVDLRMPKARLGLSVHLRRSSVDCLKGLSWGCRPK